jgi:serine/threonine-protein kinase
MLSPEYASPEHITGQPITTASDIYSLGVLLYRLLAGRQPYAFTGGTLIDLAQLVASATPEPPSTAAVRADGQGPTREFIAHARRTTPERLARALRGDLDNIVMTALRKEPDRRYRSAIQLGDDLRRHVEGLPVTARADTWSYRSGKFVRRHPFGVAVACAAVLFVAGYVATLWVQNERIRAEQARAEAAAEFLVGLFELFDPRQAQGRTVTVEDILRKGEERVDTELGAQPALQATLLDALGRVYYALGEYDQARPLLERALEGKGAQLGTKDPSYARTLDSLASTYVELERIEDAYDLRRQALAIESEALGAGSVSTAENMAQLGRLLRESGRLDDAEAALKEAIAVLEQHEGTDESLSVAQNFLASVWTLRGDLAAAQDLYVQMLERDRTRLGPDHPLMLKNLASLGVVMEQRGDYAGARCAYVEALAGMRRVLGDEHPEVGDTLAGLARVLTQLGDYAGAERQFSDALAIDRAKFGDGHFTIAYDESNLAAVVHAGGRLEEATTLYRDALDDYDYDDPRSLIYIAAAQLGLADVLVDRGLLQEAQRALADARSAWGRSPSPPAPWMLAVAQTTQGRAELAAGRYATAEALLSNGIEELAASRDAKDLRLRRALRAIVDLYERTDRASLAEPYRARLAASEAQVAQLALADCSPGASLR